MENAAHEVDAPDRALIERAWACVRDHDRPVSLSPERPVVGPPDTGHPGRQRGPLAGEGRGAAKRGDRPAHERPRLQVAHESYEVADIGIGEAQRKRIAL